MGGYVCNVAISRYVTVTIGVRDDAAGKPAMSTADRSIAEAAARRFGGTTRRRSVTSDFPIGAGLGGSSAAGVAVGRRARGGARRSDAAGRQSPN